MHVYIRTHCACPFCAFDIHTDTAATCGPPALSSARTKIVASTSTETAMLRATSGCGVCATPSSLPRNVPPFKLRRVPRLLGQKTCPGKLDRSSICMHNRFMLSCDTSEPDVCMYRMQLHSDHVWSKGLHFMHMKRNKTP